MADPVLCGPAAVALYTGDLWPAYAIDVRATGGQALNSELMALGFRCIEPASHGGNGLWHPDCGLGISVLEDCQDLPPAERANVLTVTLDRASDRYSAATAPKLRVIGVEDLIVAQTVSWFEHAPQCDDVMALLRTLVTLGRMGVCGRFRADYLRHRLACETGGEAVLDMARGAGDARDPRAMTSTAMRAVIEAWHTESGFGFTRAGPLTPDVSFRNRGMILHTKDGAG